MERCLFRRGDGRTYMGAVMALKIRHYITTSVTSHEVDPVCFTRITWAFLYPLALARPNAVLMASV